MATRLEICDALKTELAALLPTGTVVERHIYPELDPDLFPTPKIHIMPASLALLSELREEVEISADVFVSVLVYSPKLASAVLDQATNLTDTIFSLFARGGLRNKEILGCSMSDLEMIAPFDEQILRDSSFFRSVIAVAYTLADIDEVPIEVDDATERKALTAGDGLQIGSYVLQVDTEAIYKYLGGDTNSDDSWEVT